MCLLNKGGSRSDAILQVGMTEQIHDRWRKQYGDKGTDQLNELKKLQQNNRERAFSNNDFRTCSLTESEFNSILNKEKNL